MSDSISFQSFISSLDDPRQSWKTRYPLDEVMLLSLCGVISGCENFVDIALYGEEKLDFLRTLSPFEHGIPSHDTLCNVFRALDPEPFGRVFAAWAIGLGSQIQGNVVAIDGKTSRGSKAGGETPLHLISAYCVELKTVLGQRASAQK